jgi:hypothetical protein
MMSLTSHQNCRVSFDVHLLPPLKLRSVCQLAHDGFPYISHHHQKQNVYCEGLIFFSYKETESLFLHMEKITGSVLQDIGLKSMRRKQIDGRNSFVAISCNRLDLSSHTEGKKLYEPRLTVAYPNWWQKNISIKTLVIKTKRVLISSLLTVLPDCRNFVATNFIRLFKAKVLINQEKLINSFFLRG